jgi:hypothetical protein
MDGFVRCLFDAWACCCRCKLTQGRPLKIDLPRRGILPSGGPHVGGGGSGGDPGLETAGGNCEVEGVKFELSGDFPNGQ